MQKMPVMIWMGMKWMVAVCRWNLQGPKEIEKEEEAGIGTSAGGIAGRSPDVSLEVVSEAELFVAIGNIASRYQISLHRQRGRS